MKGTARAIRDAAKESTRTRPSYAQVSLSITFLDTCQRVANDEELAERQVQLVRSYERFVIGAWRGQGKAQSRPRQKSICAASLTNRGVRTEFGTGHVPLGTN